MKKSIFGVLLVAVLLVAGLVAPGLASHDGGDPPDTSDGNQASWWQSHFDDGSVCTKFDDPGDPFTVPEPGDEETWTWLVVNSGQDDVAGQGGVRAHIVENPTPGEDYRNPGGTDGAGAGVSNVILCGIQETPPENGNGEEPEEPAEEPEEPTEEPTEEPVEEEPTEEEPEEEPEPEDEEEPVTEVEPAESVEAEPTFTG